MASAFDLMAVSLGAVFAAVACGVWLARQLAADAPVTEAAREPDRVPGLWRWLGLPIRIAGGGLAAVLPRASTARLARLAGEAGLGDLLGAIDVLGAVAITALTGAAIGHTVATLWQASAWIALGGALAGAMLPLAWLRDRAARRRHSITRALPFQLDLVALAMESGLNLVGALTHTVERSPYGPLRDEIARVLADIRAGSPRTEALEALAARVRLPAVASLVAALVAAETQGAPLVPTLRAQAEQRRTERFLRAERLAMQAPVKLLFPLLGFIFPGTFVVLLFPVAMRLLAEGWL